MASSNYDPLERSSEEFHCDFSNMNFNRRFNLHRHIHRLHGSEESNNLAAALQSSYHAKWTDLFELELYTKGETQYMFLMARSKGTRKYIKYKIGRFENDLRTRDFVKLSPGELQVLNLL